MNKHRLLKAGGFTLVELLVVIAIIGVLVALLLPAVQAAREAARRTQCKNNLKNIGLALLNYEDTNKRLPAATQFRPGKQFDPINNPKGVPDDSGGTWVLEILPFIEQQALYDLWDPNKPAHHQNNWRVVGAPLAMLICPSDDEVPPGGVFEAGIKRDGTGGAKNQNPNTAQMGLWYPVSIGPTETDGCPYCDIDENPYCCQGNSFGGGIIGNETPNNPMGGPGTPAPNFAGLFGRFEKGIKLKEVTDGLSNVFMAGETICAHCRYVCAHCTNFPFSMTNVPLNTFKRMKPETGNLSSGQCDLGGLAGLADPEKGGYCDSCGYKSRHPAGAHMLMAEGSVHFVSESIDFDLFNILGARSSGQAKQLPE